MAEEVSYGIIPFRKKNDQVEVLMIQHQAGHWSFPKGHSDFQESPIETAQRELKEETGLSIRKILIPETSLVEHYVFQRGEEQVQKKVEYYLAEVEGELIMQDEEVRDSLWLSPSELSSQATFPESQRICQQAAGFLNDL